jgi:hypothetical protein
MSVKKSKHIPKLQKKADKTPLSINNGLESDIRNDTDYDNRGAEANKEADDAAKKEL